MVHLVRNDGDEYGSARSACLEVCILRMKSSDKYPLPVVMDKRLDL